MRHVMKVFVIIIFLSLAFLCLAESANDTFCEANRFYDDGKFENAAGLYERLISQGVISGNIYYNLGNAYYKMGRIGKALLNYERAEKFIPHNEDLVANISFVKSTLDIEQPSDKHLICRRIWARVRNAVSVKAWFVLSAGLFFGLCLILGTGFMNYRFRPGSRAISGVLAFMFVISFTCFIDSYNSGKHFKEGIIIVPEAEVRYSPSYSGVVAFKLAEGMKARIIRKQDSWTHVRLNRDKSGWLESEAIEAVW